MFLFQGINEHLEEQSRRIWQLSHSLRDLSASHKAEAAAGAAGIAWLESRCCEYAPPAHNPRTQTGGGMSGMSPGLMWRLQSAHPFLRHRCRPAGECIDVLHAIRTV